MAAELSQKILIIQTAFVGDLLLGIPMLKELRRLKPSHEIHLFCRKGLGGFLLKSGFVDQLIEVDKSTKESWKSGEHEALNHPYDILICPHESFRSAWLATRVNAKFKIGYKRAFNIFTFNERLRRPMELPEALRQLAMLAPLEEANRGEFEARLAQYAAAQSRIGGQTSEGLLAVPEWADMSVPRLLKLRREFAQKRDLSSASSNRIHEIAERAGLLTSKQPVVFLTPGSVWKTKQWTPEGFTLAAQQYLADGCHVIVMGAPNERAICEDIASRAPGTHVVAGETSLFESAELLALGDLLVCNDSGAMHMGAAAGIPTVAVFGPTVLEFGYRPWQSNAKVVQEDLPCRPCGKHGAKECPLGTHACMKRISPDRVFAAAKSLNTFADRS